MSVRLPFDVAKIKWEKRTNEKGEFEKSEDYDNPDFQNLLKFINDNTTTKSMPSGDYFYWVYRDGSTIGRKKRKRR